MQFPDFFAAAPVIRLHDPLAAFLGATTDGIIEYRYEDAVRLAGHSCPTVASAFLMTRTALAALYGNELPQRGEIRVDLAEAQDAGVAGVIASIATLVTGATADTGFRGLGGQFNRRNKLFFNQPLKQGSARFTRMSDDVSVEVGTDLSSVGGNSRIGELMPLCLSGEATVSQQQEFRILWQERVRLLLLEHANDPQVIKLYQ